MYNQDLRSQIWQYLREDWQKRDHPDGFHVHRPHIEAIGSDPDAAAQVFVAMKGVNWQGDYIGSEEQGWAGAWVTEVR